VATKIGYSVKRHHFHQNPVLQRGRDDPGRHHQQEVGSPVYKYAMEAAAPAPRRAGAGINMRFIARENRPVSGRDDEKRNSGVLMNTSEPEVSVRQSQFFAEVIEESFDLDAFDLFIIGA
jgi:hypothetical protein